MKAKIDFNFTWFVIIQLIMILLKNAGKIQWSWPLVFIPAYIVLFLLITAGLWFWHEKSMDRKIYKAEVRYRTDIH